MRHGLGHCWSLCHFGFEFAFKVIYTYYNAIYFAFESKGRNWRKIEDIYSVDNVK